MKSWIPLVNLLIIMSLMTFCQGGKFSFGQCKPFDSEPMFIFGGITRAYKVYARSSELWLQNLNCIAFTISARTGGGVHEFTLSVDGTNKRTGITRTFNGRLNAYGTVGFANVGSTLAITLSIPLFPKSLSYQVLYATAQVLVLYSCKEIKIGKSENALVLTTTAATAAQIDIGMNILLATGFPRHALIYSYNGC